MRVKFPSYISNSIIGLVALMLCLQALRLLLFDFDELERDKIFAKIIINLSVCFTCLIGYINDKKKMLVLEKNRGIFIEDMLMDEETLPDKFSFVYIVIAFLYNPIFSPLDSNNYWLAIHILTIGFFSYKFLYFKKQVKDSK